MIGFPYIIVTISLFTILLLLTKKPGYIFDIILSVFLFFIGFQHLYHILIINGIQTFFLPLRSGAYPLTFGPFLYLYFIFLSRENAKFKLVYWLHFLPFIILFILEGSIGNIAFIEKPIFPLAPEFPLSNTVYLIIIFLSVIVYSVLLIYKIAKHKQKTINYFSNLSIWKDLTWIYWMLGLYIVSNILIPIFHFIYTDNSSVYLVMLRGAVLLFFITGLSYFGIRQTIVFTHWENSKLKTPIAENTKYISSNQELEQETENQKYKNSKLSEEEISRIIGITNNYMDNRKPYLDPEFTIEIMSLDLNISKHKLSQCLNVGMNTNFYSFVNEKRIEEIKSEIQKNKNDKLNFLNLAFAKGFNSKSTFNNVFKNLTGMTPSKYQKQI